MPDFDENDMGLFEYNYPPDNEGYPLGLREAITIELSGLAFKIALNTISYGKVNMGGPIHIGFLTSKIIALVDVIVTFEIGTETKYVQLKSVTSIKKSDLLGKESEAAGSNDGQIFFEFRPSKVKDEIVILTNKDIKG